MVAEEAMADSAGCIIAGICHAKVPLYVASGVPRSGGEVLNAIAPTVAGLRELEQENLHAPGAQCRVEAMAGEFGEMKSDEREVTLEAGQGMEEMVFAVETKPGIRGKITFPKGANMRWLQVAAMAVVALSTKASVMDAVDLIVANAIFRRRRRRRAGWSPGCRARRHRVAHRWGPSRLGPRTVGTPKDTPPMDPFG